MDLTNPSLLRRACAGSDQAWRRLVALYRPLIQSWLARHSIQSQDVEDLCQDILTTLVHELPRFEHNGRPGAFRTWLRVITVNRARLFWRKRPREPIGTGGGDVQRMADLLESPDSELGRLWDREHDEHVLRGLLDALSGEFEPTTLEAFRRVAIEGHPAAEVADDLGVSVGAVYVAKARVLRRLREAGSGLLD